jgi:hypothetical protein
MAAEVGRKGNIGGTSIDVDIAHVGWYDIAVFAAANAQSPARLSWALS